MSRSNITYEYAKLRNSFGRQILFQDHSHILDSINPNLEDQKLYTLRSPVHRAVQATKSQAQKDTNTKQLVTREQGINHIEGGWPREVHLYNEDHLNRHRRRVMHDDNYIHTVLSLAPVMTHYVKQNNAIDMYHAYFDGFQPQEPVEKYYCRVANIFRDTHNRSVSCIVWTNESTSKLAVAYCDKTWTTDSDLSTYNTCYLWDICRQTEPVHKILPDKPCWQLACSPVNPELLVGGLENGTVCLFDIRKDEKPVCRSSKYNSHSGPITSLLYTHSRTHTEFFSGSTDGQCLWWDLRNISNPLTRLPMALKQKRGDEDQNFANTEGISSLDFNHSLPTKFLCGTESGLVINVNRMGKTHSEVLSSHWNTHTSAVRAVHRSPCTLRMFLTCGDYSVRIWSEEVRTAPIIVTRPYRYEVTDASWAPLRFSSCMSVCAGGFFYYWDFLRKHKEPVATMEVSKYGLTRLTPHRDGQSVGVGDVNGSIFLILLSETMTVPGNRDRQLMFQTYERATRREHILDTRVKEIHLKARAEEAVAAERLDDQTLDEDEIIRSTEEQYFKVVEDELSQMDVTITPNTMSII